jgi:methionine-gamma-lyase
MSVPRKPSPETLAIHGHYDPFRSEGAVKPPLFAASTFAARSAAELAHFFDQAYGLSGPASNPDGLVYSRLVNPDLEIYERRVAEFEQADDAALFASGMAAIFTAAFTFCKPGDRLLFSEPVYGGTDYLYRHMLPEWGVETASFPVDAPVEELDALLAKTERVAFVHVESPANPTLLLADIPGIVEVVRARHPEAVVAVDNTVLGPIFQRVLALGADLALYSATKMLSGHSALVAGLVMGDKARVSAIKGSRTILGNMNDPHAAWLLLRSLETLKVRAEASEAKAKKVATYLANHPAVTAVLYPGLQHEGEQQRRFHAQTTGQGSLLSFRVRGGRAEAYAVLDRLQVAVLAVSLGSTETLAEHPRTHTHSDIPPDDQDRFGISENLLRLSVGLEDADDIIADLARALEVAL